MASVQEALDQIWSDEALKQRLLSNPKPVLREFGMEIPESVRVHVHENTREVFNAVLPVKPAGAVSLGSDALSKIIEHAWSDESFKQRLLSNPKEAASEMGVQLPAAVKVKMWENTATDEHMVLPANPVETELSEMELESVSGGTSKGSPAQPVSTCAQNTAALSLVNINPALIGFTGTAASSYSAPATTPTPTSSKG